MTELRVYKGERRPIITATLEYPDGSIVDLTSCTVYFQLVEVDTGVIILNKAASVLTPATAGKAQYSWAAGDTSVPKNKYKARFEVTFADTTKQSFPKNDDFYIIFNNKEGT